MEIIWIEEDAGFLNEPKMVAAFLEDADAVYEMLQDFAADAATIAAGGNYAGILQRTADRILQQFASAEDKTRLPARRLVELAGKLERHSLEEKARKDIGEVLLEDLADILKRLKELCRKHFGPAYVALAPLGDLTLDYIDPGEVVRIFDELIARMDAMQIDGLVPLDFEAMQLFHSMVEDLRLTRAALAEASSEEMREFLSSRLAQEAGGLGVTFNRLYEKSVKGAKTVGQRVDVLIKTNKRVQGLDDILNSIESQWNGGGPT